MEKSVERRLDAVAARFAAARAREIADEGPEERERRLARERVLKEIPIAVERLSGAVAAINDRLSGTNAHLELRPSPEMRDLEACFVIHLQGPALEAAVTVNVNYTGDLTLLVGPARHPTLLNSVKVWDASSLFFLEALVSFMEQAT